MKNPVCKILVILFLIAGFESCHKPKYLNPIKPYHIAFKQCPKANFECLEGSQISELSLYSIDGKKINSNYFKGKITFINFWFAACPPCISEIPQLNNLQKKYKNTNVNFLAIGREPEMYIRDFRIKHNWHFDHIADAIDLAGIDGALPVFGYPYSMLVDENRVVLKIFLGGNEIFERIDNFLNSK